MSTLITTFANRRMKLAALGALAGLLVLLTQVLAAPGAHAQPLPPGGTPHQIIAPGQPYVPPAQMSITTDKMWYMPGEVAQICYKLPAPGYMEITDHQPNMQVHTLRAGYDMGMGGCFTGIVTPPSGQECLRLVYWSPFGGSRSASTCFFVYQPFYPF